MDLSVQKMQPPAALQKKSAAKRTEPENGNDAVEDVIRDQMVRFAHGNTQYGQRDPEEQKEESNQLENRKGRRKKRQLLSREDLSELTSSLELQQNAHVTADGRMSLRAYKTSPPNKEDEEGAHLEINI